METTTRFASFRAVRSFWVTSTDGIVCTCPSAARTSVIATSAIVVFFRRMNCGEVSKLTGMSPACCNAVRVASRPAAPTSPEWLFSTVKPLIPASRRIGTAAAWVAKQFFAERHWELSPMVPSKFPPTQSALAKSALRLLHGERLRRLYCACTCRESMMSPVKSRRRSGSPSPVCARQADATSRIAKTSF